MVRAFKAACCADSALTIASSIFRSLSLGIPGPLALLHGFAELSIGEQGQGFAAYLVRRISPQPMPQFHLKFCLAQCRCVAPPRREIPEVSFLTWLRQIQCEAFEIAERAMDQGTIVGSTQDYPGRLVCIESFLPAGRT
jgi:hypothetical protein